MKYEVCFTQMERRRNGVASCFDEIELTDGMNRDESRHAVKIWVWDRLDGDILSAYTIPKCRVACYAAEISDTGHYTAILHLHPVNGLIWLEVEP